eukprot:scaffold14.g1154.t1
MLTPPDQVAMRRSMSPRSSKRFQRTQNRQAAAHWVAALTGVTVPAGDDAEFLAALADGVTLCRLANVLQPGAVPKIIEGAEEARTETGEIIQTFENVSNFLAIAGALTAETFSAADLASPDGGDTVAKCLLALRDWYDAERAAAGFGGVAQRSPVVSVPSPAASSPGAAGTPCSLPSPQPSVSPTKRGSGFSFTPHAQQVVAKHGASAVGTSSDGQISYLMRSCNNMMRHHMGVPVSPLPAAPKGSGGITSSEIALDAVGPVLETVIQNLTTEYEKRLLAKDQDFKHAAEERGRLRKQIAAMQGEVEHWRAQAEAAAAAAVPLGGGEPELTEAQREEYERLLEQQVVMEEELARREEEMAAMEAEHCARAEAVDEELAALREEVQNYRGLNERYSAIAEENRQLYNTVQARVAGGRGAHDLRGNIRVFCRVRPRGATGDHTTAVVEVDAAEGLVSVFSHKHNKWHGYKFDRVFGEGSDQGGVYEETKPLIRSVLDGYNVCIFAYGQTGSGKTHTMSGTNVEAYEGRGINFRALDDLFELNRQRHAEVEYDIRVQLLEIYNESLRDLLVPQAQQRPLALQNTQRSGSNVPDAVQVPVACAEDVLRLMAQGAANRAVAQTSMNERSSRSHQVLTVMVEGVNRISHARTHGCLHLIDLAGSERVGRSGAEGQQLVEAQYINKSLSSLGSVMHALAGKAAHDSLSGQAKSMMFMHIAPEMSSVSETLSTLNFGRHVTEITLGAAKKNSESGTLVDAKDRLRRVEAEATAAKQALAVEQERSAALEAEMERLRAQLASMAASTAPSSEAGSDAEEAGAGTIPAFRPAAPGVAPPRAAQLGGATGSGSGLTPRSRLQQPGRAGDGPPPSGSRGLTPRGGAGGGGLTPRGSSGSGARPPGVSRLNLSSGPTPSPAAVAGKAGLGSGLMKLNLSKLQSDAQENATPGSARRSKIPMPSPLLAGLPSGLPSGAASARPALGQSPSLGAALARQGSMSARGESPAEALARKAAAAAAPARASSLRQPVGARRIVGPADAANRLLNSTTIRRSTSGDMASTLNSARGARSSLSTAPSRRWQ